MTDGFTFSRSLLSQSFYPNDYDPEVDDSGGASQASQSLLPTQSSTQVVPNANIQPTSTTNLSRQQHQRRPFVRHSTVPNIQPGKDGEQIGFRNTFLTESKMFSLQILAHPPVPLPGACIIGIPKRRG